MASTRKKGSGTRAARQRAQLNGESQDNGGTPQSGETPAYSEAPTTASTYDPQRNAGNVDAGTVQGTSSTGPVQTGTPEGATGEPKGKGKGKGADKEEQETRPGYMRGDLNGSYGYTDPATGATKFFGPGKNVEFPKGLGFTLGFPGSR